MSRRTWIVVMLVAVLASIGGLWWLMGWRVNGPFAQAKQMEFEQQLNRAGRRAAEAERRLHEASVAHVAMREQLSEAEARYQVEKDMNDPLREEVSARLAAQLRAQRQLEQTRARITALEDRIVGLEADIANRDHALAAEREAQRTREDRHAATELELAKLHGTLIDRQAEAATRQETAATQAASIKRLTHERDAARQQVEQLRDALGQANAQVEALRVPAPQGEAGP